jgi:hypothetical protein
VIFAIVDQNIYLIQIQQGVHWLELAKFGGTMILGCMYVWID